MRVDDTSTQRIDLPATVGRTERTPPSGTQLPTPAQTQSGATVVSSHADQVSAATDRGRAAHASHLAAVRTQLQAGTYTVDRQALASRMADDEISRSGQ